MRNKNIVTVENECHSIPEMLHNHEHRLNKLETTEEGNKSGLVSHYLSYYTDNFSPVIQAMIEDGVTHIIFNEPITYHFKTTGIDEQNRPYCVAFDNMKEILIEGCIGHKITYNYAENQIPNLFTFHNSQDIELRELNFEGVNKRSRSQGSTELYTGSVIYCYKCNNVYVHNINSKNVTYQFLAFYTSDIDIFRTFNCHDYYAEPFQASTVPYAFIQCHSCYGFSIDSCTHYGGCRDGDITIFGGGGQRARISNNRLMCYGYDDKQQYPFNLSQAICNDQGCENAIIEGNFITGYYYGIDMKADVRNCICTGNIIKNCKVYIADRRGESTGVYQTQFNHIINNMIILQDVYEGNSVLFNNMYYLVGILCENRQGCHIENNTITVNLNTGITKPYPCLGIFYSQESINDDYLYPSTITNNHIIYTVGNIGTVLHATGGSTMLHLKNVKFVNLSENTFKGSYNRDFKGIKYEGSCGEMRVMDNQFYMKSADKVYYEQNTSTTNIIHNINGYEVHKKSGCLRECGQELEIKEYLTGDFGISANVPTDLMKFEMTASRILFISIKGVADWNGEKYVDATYRLKKDGSGQAWLYLRNGVCDGYEFTVTYDGTSCTVQVKCDTDVPNNRFKIDIMQGKYGATGMTLLK